MLADCATTSPVPNKRDRARGVYPPPPENGSQAILSGSGGWSGFRVRTRPIRAGEARHRIAQVAAWENWAAEMRRADIWTQAQERRALLFGRFFLADVLSQPPWRKWVRDDLAKRGRAAEIELWSEANVRADYTPRELGEGGPF